MEEIDVAEREVLDVIRQKYDDIFPAEKKAADFILDNPVEAVKYNVAELAKASGVSDATIIRMCHHLGYSGYYQFRLALSRDIGKKLPSANPDPVPNDVVKQLFEEYASIAASVGNKLNVDLLRGCVRLLREADMVHIIAVGNTSNIARYMGFRLERLGIRSTCSDLPEYFINHINLAGKKDVVLAISKSGLSKRVIDGLKLAKDKHLSIIVITAYTLSPVACLADYVLDSSGQENSENYYKGYSYLNEFLIVEALLNCVVNEEMIKQKLADRPEMVLAESKI